MSKEKEEGKYFTSLYKTLYEFNANPLGAAGFKGAKYGQAIMDAVDSGQTLAGLTEEQQIYILEVMKNILYPKSRDPEEEGGSIPNLEFLKNLPKNFINSLNESARSVLESWIQEQDSTITFSTASTTTTSISTTSSLEKSFTSTSFSSTSEPKTTTTVSTTTLPLGGNPIDGESSPTVTTSRTVTTTATSHSSTILFSPLDPIVSAIETTSTELTGQNPTADTE
jgi:hypothetical protein